MTDITNLTAREELIMKETIRQMNESIEKRYTLKNPVASVSALINLVDVVEGETRQVLSKLPKIVSYTYNTTNTDGLTPIDSALTGKWKSSNIFSLPVPANQPNEVVPRSVMDSRAGGLLTNGTGLIGSAKSKYGAKGDVMYNFDCYASNNIDIVTDGNLLDGVGMGFSTSGSTFIGTEPNGSTNEIMAVNPNNVYKGSGTVTVNEAGAIAKKKCYVGHAFKDLNGYSVTAANHQHMGLAKLAQDLVLGTDDHIYITREGFEGAHDPHTEWNIGSSGANAYALRRGPIFWDHRYQDQKLDESGVPIPFTTTSSSANGNINKPAGFGYSKHWVEDLWDNTSGLWVQADDGTGAGNWNGYTNVWKHPIKLSGFVKKGSTFSPNPSGTLVAEGTWLSHNWHGGTYKYCYMVGTKINDSKKFFRYSGFIGGIDYSGRNRAYNFPPGTAGAVWMMLSSYTGNSSVVQYHSALSLNPDSSVDLLSRTGGVEEEHSYFSLKRYKISGSSISVVRVTRPKITEVLRTQT